MPDPPRNIEQGEVFWCEPDPKDTEGSEQQGDRVWVVMSIPRLHRGKCVVGLPLSRHIEKAGAHLIQIPQREITVQDGSEPMPRVALTDQIRALDKNRLRKKHGFISIRAVNAIILGIEYLLGSKPAPIKRAN